MPSVRRHLALVAALALGPALGAAEFEEWTETSDWYLSLGAAPMPEIEERASGTGGTSTYEWQSLEGDFAPRLAIGYLACAGGARGGWMAGIEGVFTTCDVTPERYKVGSQKFSNTSDRTLRYTTAGVLITGGYQFGINSDADRLNSFLLIGPYLGLGAAFADSEVRDQGGTYASDTGVGWYAEGGLRGGFILTERNWIGGVLVDFTYSAGEVDCDFSDGSTSTLTHERLGLTAALVIGYRL